MEKPLHHYDKRIVRRSIKKGLVSEEELGGFLSTLPDQSENIMAPEPEAPPGEAPSEVPTPPVDQPAGGA